MLRTAALTPFWAREKEASATSATAAAHRPPPTQAHIIVTKPQTVR